MDVSQYLEIFIDETNGHLQNLSDCIMSLEKDPENMDTINEIFRAAHSLKGMAGTMGFKRMQRLTHDMENVFQEVRSGNMVVTSGLVDVLFQCLDAIDSYLENVKESSEEGTDDNEAIIQELNDILAAGTGNAPKKEEKVEEKKREETSSENRFQKKYLDIEFSEKEKEEMRKAEEKGMKLYGVTVYIQEDCLLKAARSFLVFKAVEDYGNIIVYNPSSQDIEDEKFGFDFSFYLASETELDKIIEVSKAVSEIEEVIGEKVIYRELTEAAAKKEEAEAEAAKKEEAEKEQPAENTAVQAPAAAAPAQPKQAQAAKKQNSGKPVTNRTVRVDIEKLDALMNQVSELIIAKNSLVSIGSTSDGGMGGSNSQAFHEQIEYLERITTGLHESVMKVRMVPIESVVQKFPRMIRDLSKKLDKKMELYMTGEDTELDRTVVDQIGDPLQHLLRNSADHGLENAEIRRKRGKPETGSIHLNAFQEGNNVIIEVSDDGNGIDTESVKGKAIERGLITPEQGAALSQKEIIDFLFMPSFSMAKQISDVSGRGVGLDVVKSNIETLGGDVEVKSILGEGSKFT
ncbi:MAG: chemotaxis protein CheA, partial [Lachnospiraceae bacterium]|nr:chemotaxis protein CheA [Lachnospiraceae bacterium]